MLEYAYNMTCSQPLLEGPEDAPFTVTVRNKFVKGAPTSLKSSGVTLLCRPEFTVGTAGSELGNLNAMRIFGTHIRGAKWQHCH